MFTCNEFGKSVEERNNFVKQSKICRNCLLRSDSRKYISKARCLQCNKDQHTMLHLKNLLSANTVCQPKGIPGMTSVLLVRALVRVESPTGKSLMVCAIIGPGSRTSFIVLDAEINYA